MATDLHERVDRQLLPAGRHGPERQHERPVDGRVVLDLDDVLLTGHHAVDDVGLVGVLGPLRDPTQPLVRHERGTLARVFERRLHALAVGAALLATALVLTLVVAQDAAAPPFQTLDDRWLAWMQRHRTPWLTSIARFFSDLGSAAVTVPFRLVVAALLAARRRWLHLVAFVGATITAELCIGPLKALIERARPPGALLATRSEAFPSGHAITGAVVAFGLVVVLVPPSPRRLRWIGVAATFAGLMALSRTYLGVHWLSDVVAGTLIGTGWALVWPAALELIAQRGGLTSTRSEPVPGASVKPSARARR